MVVVIHLPSGNLSEMVFIYYIAGIKTLFPNRSHLSINESIYFGNLIRWMKDFNPF